MCRGLEPSAHVSGAPHRYLHVIFAYPDMGMVSFSRLSHHERKPGCIHTLPCRGLLGAVRFECMQTTVECGLI